ncbi:helix-turn-helix domain-containing protein [Streptomyces antimycoticus]|uniref:Helix-turn-helix domain-containing protein n=2 Tax=Streptomyces violaceusniger group TaxID=2839105 RepID=A0ABD5J461_9ACTN|nr:MULTISPECIES: helix-turn-helix domain-containing protein [Streptomyces]MEE4583121.1 helix-turn-helix domain-containing protein [Streptomyces sp. DSM 41602]WJE00930.1 helix-turn-helix domain-containing protein [Streptomyces antimycoticus]WTA80260.1 helix-turn-helix domain-containing protein [Streptomyces antimycoticus]WTB09549.1 helix-turn-helix domain-containing protein [Streptomyces antimycoticus]
MPDFTEMSGQGGTGPVVTVGTDSVPAPERLGWWSEMVDHEVMPVAVHSAHTAVFRGRAEAVELPHSQVTAFDFSPITAHRSPAHIRRQDPENYYLLLVRDSSVRLEQARGVACLQAGDMALFSTSHPLACEFLDHGRQTRLTLMRLPRPVPPLAGGQADRLLAEPLPPRAGSAALLGLYLAQLPQTARTCGPAELARLGAIGVDLAVTLLAARLGVQDTLPTETRNAALLARINAFIDHHLGDPELCPAAIAAHHHVSVRTLHLLFHSEPETVSARIRRRRLEHCHADLTDPRLRRRSISAIAARWGFLRPADFSRAFRAAYGVAPRELRQAALRSLPDARRVARSDK